jgi:hypothetical protein
VDTADPVQAALIRRTIAGADYALVLTAWHYGLGSAGLVPADKAGGEKSREEAEYEEALRQGVPVLAFTIAEKARWKASKRDKDAASVSALGAFNERLGKGSGVRWSNGEDLKQAARELLSREFFLNPRPGWVAGDGGSGPEPSAVMARLVAENEELKAALAAKADPAGHEAELEHSVGLLEGNAIPLSFFYAPGDTWETPTSFSYLKLFKVLAPELFTGKSSSEISRFLGNVLNPDLSRIVRRDYPVPSNSIKKLLADFCLLKLCICTGGGADELWELSPHGREVFAWYRFHRQETPQPPASPQ